MAPSSEDLDALSTAELGALARHAMTLLAGRAEPQAFSELLLMNGHAGQCLGEAARVLAAAQSWTQVGDLSGVTKQAAWSRWRA